jgi:histidine ammonia-lyase
MLPLDPTNIDVATLRRMGRGETASLDDASMQRVASAAASVERIVAGGETVYGVNTGFGLFANTRIPDDRLAELLPMISVGGSAEHPGRGPQSQASPVPLAD